MKIHFTSKIKEVTAVNDIKWTKNNEFVEIETVTTVSGGGSAFVVKTNVFDALTMPVEWKDQVSKNDHEAVKYLFETVGAWAVENGFSS